MRFWTPERIRRLREIAGAGFSMSEAGQRIGCTRNAIAGAAFRHDVVFACSAERHAVLVSAGATLSWARDDGSRRKANAELARRVFGARRNVAGGAST